MSTTLKRMFKRKGLIFIKSHIIHEMTENFLGIVRNPLFKIQTTVIPSQLWRVGAFYIYNFISIQLPLPAASKQQHNIQ